MPSSQHGFAVFRAPGPDGGLATHMAPELFAEGAPSVQSDLYSLGATFYHLVTGKRVFEGGTPLSIVIKQAKEEPVPVEQIEPGRSERDRDGNVRCHLLREADRFRIAGPPPDE